MEKRDQVTWWVALAVIIICIVVVAVTGCGNLTDEDSLNDGEWATSVCAEHDLVQDLNAAYRRDTTVVCKDGYTESRSP